MVAKINSGCSELLCSSCPSAQKCDNIATGALKSSQLELFVEPKPAELTEEQEAFKRALYEKMNPRRRKFIDRIGYEQWDPFQAPKDPLDIRTDRTNRTWQDLFVEFMRQNNGEAKDRAWQKGAKDCALGIIQKDVKYQGIFDFCLWYAKLLKNEGYAE